MFSFSPEFYINSEFLNSSVMQPKCYKYTICTFFYLHIVLCDLEQFCTFKTVSYSPMLSPVISESIEFAVH